MNLLVATTTLLLVGLSWAQGPGAWIRPQMPDGPPGGRPGSFPGEGQRPPRGGHEGHRGRPGFRKPGPPSILHLFSACQEMDRAISEVQLDMWKRSLIGPTANRCNFQNRKECMFKDMNTVRCAVSTVPSEACIQEVMAYITGTSCGTVSTTTDMTTVVDAFSEFLL